MKKVLLIYVVLIAGIVTWYYGVGKEKRIFSDSKAIALKVSKHSRMFNLSFEEMMTDYYTLTVDFARNDSVSVNKNALTLKHALDSLRIGELRRDSAIYETASSTWENTKADVGGILDASSLEAKRESFNQFSNDLFTLLLTIRYDLAKIFWMECSSAFGDDTPGNWISASDKVQSPYGKPGCATLKKVINFMPADSTKQ